MKALCDFCGWIENIRLSDNPVTMSQHGIRFTYDETRALCADCGRPVYVAEISDQNAEKRLAAFEKAKRNNVDGGHET